MSTELSIKVILDELNESNSSTYKVQVLEKYKNNEQLARVLKMTYDKVEYTYGLTLQRVMLHEMQKPFKNHDTIDLSAALDILEKQICSRKITGNAAIELVHSVISSLNDDDSYILQRIIDRNIKCNIGRTQINKVFANLITKPVYMRCGVFNDKTKKKIVYPATLQMKCDGTYREFTVQNGEVQSRSRSGESYDYPALFDALRCCPDGVYFGELTVRGVTDRSIGNGMINSKDVPYDDLVFDAWDYVTIEEYKNAVKKEKNKIPYIERFNTLKEIFSKNIENSNIRIVETHVVNDVVSALQQTSKWMNAGFEGAVLKNNSSVFKNGTNNEQLKMKIKIDAEMRIVGYQDGSIGTKREGKVGSIIFENDEKTIKGRTSGFNDKLLDEISNNREKYIGKIICVEFNDLTKAESHDYYSLSHPRFIEFRDDKDSTDCLQRVLDMREMAITLS